MASTIQVRVDDDLKKKSDNLFKELGTDTTTAIRMFLTQAVAHNGFPFEIKRISENPYLPLSEEQLLEIECRRADPAALAIVDNIFHELQDYESFIK